MTLKHCFNFIGQCFFMW